MAAILVHVDHCELAPGVLSSRVSELAQGKISTLDPMHNVYAVDVFQVPLKSIQKICQGFPSTTNKTKPVVDSPRFSCNVLHPTDLNGEDRLQGIVFLRRHMRGVWCMIITIATTMRRRQGWYSFPSQKLQPTVRKRAHPHVSLANPMLSTLSKSLRKINRCTYKWIWKMRISWWSMRFSLRKKAWNAISRHHYGKTCLLQSPEHPLLFNIFG